MIPALVVGFGITAFTVEILSGAAAAGTGYGMGRKYGRIICEKLDHAETIVKASIDKFK